MLNFSAGPNQLPRTVDELLLRAAKEYPDTDIPAWSISHRDSRVHDAFDQCIALVKELLGVPDTFEVLFTQAGASGMFKAWPLNICSWQLSKVDIVCSGHWASEAYRGLQELEVGDLIKIGTLHGGWGDVSYQNSSQGHFLYLVSNETVNGTQLPDWDMLPLDAPPLIIDMSSDIMMRPIDWSRVGLVFASTQKNLGITAGFCLVIVRKDLLEAEPHPLLAAPLSFQEQMKHRGGLRNTVNPLGVLSILYTLRWIKERGGVEAMQQQAAARAKFLYDAIDGSGGFFEGLAPRELRSTTNITFRTRDEDRREAFLKFCLDEGCVGLKGHAALAKIAGPHARASMYISTPIGAAEVLAMLMGVFRP
jgi:phosphoserine aminotransferase